LGLPYVGSAVHARLIAKCLPRRSRLSARALAQIHIDAPDGGS
jgi:hypothetical protein